ncbi:IstB-like ATP-binding protein [Burkholderia lata]|uniref:IstB-like ATP-binding protein n=1 Tax=Burkholderia lata (strain ATCC 17760 / DSM 23089 / LMG 22485 / NCIMB 9086 / R18194 / 383) TaxID=482957 RepID=A0A6P2NTF0_BURL3|nr:IstB-like ATP-binding protein [Burkholderia lata]
MLDDRFGTRSAIITSQLSLEHWRAWLQNPALTDAIHDRLVRQAHKLRLKSESMRKTNTIQCSAS